MNPSPGTWLVAEARSWDEPGCNTTTCGVHAAHSNHIKPLNLVDQSQEASGAGLAVARVRWVTFRDNRRIPRAPHGQGHRVRPRASRAGRHGTIRSVIRSAPAGRSEWNGAGHVPARPRIPRQPEMPSGDPRGT